MLKIIFLLEEGGGLQIKTVLLHLWESWYSWSGLCMQARILLDGFCVIKIANWDELRKPSQLCFLNYEVFSPHFHIFTCMNPNVPP